VRTFTSCHDDAAGDEVRKTWFGVEDAEVVLATPHANAGRLSRDETASAPGCGDAHHHSVDVLRVDSDDPRTAAVGGEVAAGDSSAQGADAQPGAFGG